MDNALITLLILVVILALLIYVSIRNPAKNPLTRLIRIILFLALVITIIVIAVREYGPNGRNPIFSEAGRGENEGEDEKQSSPDKKSGSGSTVYAEVYVRGFEVTVNGYTYDCSGGDHSEIDAALTGLVKSGDKFRVVDDYAVSSVYHHVVGILEQQGASIEEITFGAE